MAIRMLKLLTINELQNLYKKYTYESRFWINGIDDDELNYNVLLSEIKDEIRSRIIQELLK
jgi:hypothetical protein